MKQYKITVNGKAYDVAVEEVGGANAPAFTTAPTYSAPAAPAAPVYSAPAAPVQQAPKAAPAAAGGELISAPMPGTILSINVTVGQKLKAGDILLILEAMKMENEIVAPVDGTVTSIHTTKGTSVNTGDALVTLG